MPLSKVLDRLIAGSDLSRDEAHALMGVFAQGQAPAEQVAGVLVALQMKGVTPPELAGLADVLRERAIPLSTQVPYLVDTCGTGGGRSTFNLSTGAAIVAAAAGAKVAKHGNRSVTSHCGSADVLEALGVRLTGEPSHLAVQLERTGFVFLFAPNHHPAMKTLGPVRKTLGIRTVFNQLGPLANPAGATRQLIGVYAKELLSPMADALVLLGVEHAFIVHSQDGLDEVSPCAPTDYAEVSDGTVREGQLTPQDFGFDPLPSPALACGSTVADSAAILRAALRMEDRARALALVPNAAVALVLGGIAESLAVGSSKAIEALESGGAGRKLDELVEATTL